MRKTVLSLSFLSAVLFGFAACNDKQPATPMPNVVTYGSSSVTVDSIAPDSALVIVEDTTVTVGVVTDGADTNANKKAKPSKHSKSATKSKSAGKSKTSDPAQHQSGDKGAKHK